jgi:two-component system, response regulator PdtaR
MSANGRSRNRGRDGGAGIGRAVGRASEPGLGRSSPGAPRNRLRSHYNWIDIVSAVNFRRQQRPRRPTILIIEDDIVLRDPLAEYLRCAGYEIFEAANSAEAVAVFDADIVVDAVFSDIRMAGPTDGVDLARWIRRRHPDVHIVLTSGADSKALAETVAEIFIAKPYHLADITGRIGQLLAATLPPAASSSEAPSTGGRRRSRSRRNRR